jgi:flagellar biosynthesis protein
MRNQEKGEKIPKTVALRYIPKSDHAPKITAKGSGRVAEKIIALAKEHGIPIQEDPALIQVLSQLDFYEEIPPSVYGVVAEILAFIYSLNQKYRSTTQG